MNRFIFCGLVLCFFQESYSQSNFQIISVRSNAHKFGGAFNDARSVFGCLNACYRAAEPQCFGVDWDTDGAVLQVGAPRCYLHQQTSWCDTNTYRKRATFSLGVRKCPVICLNPSYEIFLREKQRGGVVRGSGLSLVECKRVCTSIPTCVATDWEARPPFRCWVHDTSGNLERNDTYIHCRRVCSTSPTQVTGRPTQPTTTTKMATPRTSSATETRTTIASSVGSIKSTTISRPRTTIIPSNGVCGVDVFETIHNALLPAGSLAHSSVVTLEQCKQACVANSSCASLNYDSRPQLHPCTLIMYTNDSQPGLVRGVSYSTHLSKLQCSESRCWTHAATNALSIPDADRNNFLSLNSDNYMNVSGVSLVACSGACTYDFDFTNLLFTRGCEPNNHGLVKRCSQNVAVGRCVCEGDRCNSDISLLTQACLLYYPFDRNAMDRSLGHRNGQARGVTFSMSRAQKGQTAFFDGSAYVNTPGFSNVKLGALDAGPPVMIRPSLTVAFWMLRTSSSGLETLVSNGPQDSPLQIQSTAVGGGFHNVSAGLSINGEFYSVSALAPLNEWSYVLFRSGPVSQDDLRNQLTLIVNSTLIGTGTVDAITITPTMFNETMIDISGYGLTIGGQVASVSTPTTYTNLFKGYIDEFYIFGFTGNSLSMKSLFDLSSPFP